MNDAMKTTPDNSPSISKEVIKTEYPISFGDKVFIYNLHTAFRTDNKHLEVVALEHKATDVVQTGKGRFEFNLTGLEGRFETYYGWSLVADIPENSKLIETYRNLLDIRENTAKALENIYSQIKTLG